MAIIQNPFGGGTLIGSIGSTTFQRGRFGNLARTRTKPVDPNTQRQQSIKVFMSQASSDWDTLSAGDIAGWNSYAENTPIMGPKGSEITLTGRQMFMRARMFQLNGGFGPGTFPPSVPGVPAIPSVVFTYELNGEVKATNAIDLPSTGAIRFLTSRNLRPTRNYWKGPFEHTFATSLLGAFPHLIATISPVPVAGEKVFVKYKVWDADQNTVSPAAITEVVAAAL